MRSWIKDAKTSLPRRVAGLNLRDRMRNLRPKSQLMWLVHLIRMPFGDFLGQLGGDLGADQEFAGGITYFIWPPGQAGKHCWREGRGVWNTLLSICIHRLAYSTFTVPLCSKYLKSRSNNIFYVVLHLNCPLSNVMKKLHKLFLCVGSRGQHCVWIIGKTDSLSQLYEMYLMVLNWFKWLTCPIPLGEEERSWVIKES